MRVIEDLFYGNICPCEKSLTCGSEYSQLLNLAVKNEEKFSVLLSPQQKEMFEKVKDCITDVNNILEKEAFIIEWVKNKILCIKYGKKECCECKYYYDDGDWWGCNLEQKTIENNILLVNKLMCGELYVI